MKRKILYLMHVDWHWIKQRPHFLAEGLSASFNVLVASPHSNRRSNLVRNETSIFRIPVISLPFSRFKIINYINNCIGNLYFWILMVFYKPTIIWITFPTLAPLVGSGLLKNKLVIYDCMDDAPEFATNSIEKMSFLRKEKELLQYADLVFVSSMNLYTKLLERGVLASKLVTVRNAYGGSICEHNVIVPLNSKPNAVFKILFVGAIGEHLDFDILLYCIDSLAGVEFHFYGPVTTNVPTHERLKFYGAVEHSKLPTLVQQFDSFIMPFIVNELIQGVDPVKLYEYVNFNKNIICPFYSEINRFSEFVHFYRNKDEFVSIVKKLLNDNKLMYDSKQRRLFLENNSWESRLKIVEKSITDQLKIKYSSTF